MAAEKGASSTTPSQSGTTTPVDPALANKPICKVREKKNASLGGKSQKDRSQFATDQKLRDLLSSADGISSLEHFTYWKDEFLDTFRQYLDPEQTANAREADEQLELKLQELAKICLKVKQLCVEGSISEDGSAVKGIQALNEFIAEMARIEKLLHAYFPKTAEDEARVGYNKFTVAAVLVRDGFRVYGLLVTTRDYIVKLRDGPLKPGDILKPNSRSIMEFYLKGIDSFCDTLADLGMHKLMTKCVELYKIRPRKKKKKAFNRETMDPLSDSSDEETINNGRVFRRPKTNFRSIMDKGWTSGTLGSEVHDPQKQHEEPTPERVVPAKVEEEELPDPEKPNEWIYYYDPTTDTVGKIPRRKAMSQNFIIRQDSSGKEQQDSAIQEWDGKEGKGELIWKLKEACKGKGKRGAK